MKKILLVSIAAVLVLAALGVGVVLMKHRSGVAEADAEWLAHRPAALGDIGTTRTLEILPLVDWHAGAEGLKTDMGVSYLVRTDAMTILFDTGNNTRAEDPSPLTANMEALGVSLDEVDAVVISHAHFDHVGGKQFTAGKLSGSTFGIGNAQPSLGDKRVVVPTTMTYPGSEPETARDPIRLAAGVATTGTIPRKLFIGRIDEQALAVNVAGKGIVLIVGCGHQTLSRLIERTEAVFDAPIHGVVGGLHYPVPEGRMVLAGLNIQRLAASGGGPLDPISEDEVDAELALLEDRKVGLVGIGGHDSGDDVIESAAKRFGDAYRYVRVGERIRVEGTPAELSPTASAAP